MGNWTSRSGYIFGPNIYRIHNTSGLPAQNYHPTALEENSQKILKFLSSTKTILYYTLPVWSVMLYRRGFFTISYATDFFKYTGIFLFLYFGLMVLRGIGRSQNQEYVDFLSVLNNAKNNPGRKRVYDFDFDHWPIDFEWNEAEEEKKNDVTIPPYHLTGRLRKVVEKHSVAGFIVGGLPCELLSYVIAHGFGLSMVYPGSTGILNLIIGPNLQDGRNKLVENHQGLRAKLKTRDGNFLDTMFVDRRVDTEKQRHSWHVSDEDLPSNILVIGCEGNAGFYEVGVMVTPMEAGYSVLGWNHPGFGASTGTPSPAAEIHAVDTVMQYAIHRLHFQPENIILFGWSIGAFSAIQAAVMYPDIRGLFLDATFDDVVPLAVKAMPEAFEGIVKRTMRGYINLQHGELIKGYRGPVHFVRRQMDEVMNKDGQRVVASNCGNPLLVNFLLHRYPQLFAGTEEEKILIRAALDSWLNRDDDVMRLSVQTSYGVEDQHCEVILKSYLENNSAEFPLMIGQGLRLETKQQLVLYLAAKHMSHFESTHCQPLPAVMFIKPWDIKKDLAEVSTSQCSSSDEFEIVNGNSGQ